jgi:NADH dehydrogenase (ubiquinone) 1 alpha subcomplex subunit 5
MALLEKTLKEVKCIPEGAPYREAVEAYTTHRLNVCRELHNDAAIEEEIDQGCLEELIEIQKGELDLIPFYHDNRMWETREEFLARKAGTAESQESGFGGRLAPTSETTQPPTA